MLRKQDGTIVELSIGEWIALLTVVYIVCVATFNAGYFSIIPSRFDLIFSFADLVGTNISVLQYFFSIFTTACSIHFAINWLVRPMLRKLVPRIESFIVSSFSDSLLLYLICLFLILLFLLARIVVDTAAAPSLTLDLTCSP